MKAKVIYIEEEKAKRINAILEAEKEFLENNNKNKKFKSL